MMYAFAATVDLKGSYLKALLHWWVRLSVILCVLTITSLVYYGLSGYASLLIQPAPEMKSLLPFARASAVFYTPSMFASFLHVSIAFLLALMLSKNNFKYSHVFYLILMLVCAIFTESRIILGIFITIFLAILPVRNSKFISMLKYMTFVSVVVLSMFVLLVNMWCVFPAKVESNKDACNLSISINTAPSPYAILNDISFKIIGKGLWTGIGPGMFNQVMPSLVNWDTAEKTYKTKGFMTKDVALDPHNTYLGWAAESGVLFIVIFLIMIIGMARFIWNGYAASTDDFIKTLCYVCLCGLVGFMINALYIDIITMRQFWLMLGIGTSSAAFVLNRPKA